MHKRFLIEGIIRLFNFYCTYNGKMRFYSSTSNCLFISNDGPPKKVSPHRCRHFFDAAFLISTPRYLNEQKWIISTLSFWERIPVGAITGFVLIQFLIFELGPVFINWHKMTQVALIGYTWMPKYILFFIGSCPWINDMARKDIWAEGTCRFWGVKWANPESRNICPRSHLLELRGYCVKFPGWMVAFSQEKTVTSYLGHYWWHQGWHLR